MKAGMPLRFGYQLLLSPEVSFVVARAPSRRFRVGDERLRHRVIARIADGFALGACKWPVGEVVYSADASVRSRRAFH